MFLSLLAGNHRRTLGIIGSGVGTCHRMAEAMQRPDQPADRATPAMRGMERRYCAAAFSVSLPSAPRMVAR